MKKIFLLIATVLQCAFVFSQDNHDPNKPIPLDPNVRYGKLENGITYYIRYNAKPQKRAELRIAINAGSTMENDDQQGLAHFTEHMCFNGTKNFKKNELVDYLESVGTKFGPHLNAYTSFDETVYMIQIPTDKEDIIQKGFQILEDWSHNVSFDTTEINKERGVVTEEWRLGLGAQERMRQKYFPVLFKGSRYAVRLPIGKKEILQNCKPQTMIDFYKDWYRPDLMAVIAVGDFDVDKMEALIKERFSKVPVKENPRKIVEWQVPDHAAPMAVSVSDKENSYTSIQIVYKQKEQFKAKTLGDYPKALAIDLFNIMFNKRMEELTRKPDAPFTYGYGYYSSFVRTKDAYVNFAVTQEKDIEKGITAFATENERVKKFGFTATEFERAKIELLRNLEQQKNEKDKTESRNLAGQFVYHFLTGEKAEGAEKAFKISSQVLPLVKLDDVNALAKKWISNGENMVVIVMAPEKEGVKLPDEKSVLDIIKKAQTIPVTAYVDEVSNKPLFAGIPSAGSIESETINKDLNITEWKLSNGIKLIFKPTDFKNDQILFSARSNGGTSLLEDKDYISANNAAGIIDESGIADFDKTQLDKNLNGKIVSVYPYISSLNEGLRGNCSPQDLETLMQLINLYFTKPRKDNDAFQTYLQQEKAFIENRQLNPSTAFYDTIGCTMSSYNFRSRPQSIELLNEINFEKAYELYKNRFADAGDFTFYFVGNIDREIFKSLVTTYLTSLPSTGSKENWKDLNIQPPKGLTNKTIKKGMEPKSSVQMQFYDETPYNRNSRYELMALMNLVNIKLRESMREDKGGVYGVGAYGNHTHYPKEKFNISINWGCAPENVEMLIKTALDELEKIKQNGCDEKDLTKIKETMKREREVNLRENNFWLQSISQFDYDGENISEMNDINTFIDNLNSEKLKQAANKYFAMKNYARFVLLPEK